VTEDIAGVLTPVALTETFCQPDRWILAGMKVELLVVADYPDEASAAALLRTALDDVGLARIPIATTVIDTAAEAERRGFIGSPTILIDGHDPFVEPGQPAGLGRRTYRNSTGAAGIPDLRRLRQALKQAAAANLQASGVV
jgi:hypothetical protein